MLRDGNTKPADAELPLHNVAQLFNVFRQTPFMASDLRMLDHFHKMQICMLDHLQKWIFNFIKMHKRLNKYNAIGLSVPAYHDLSPKYQLYADDSQWNRKDMKEMSGNLLEVVTQSL
jgi:hypothetical protein